MAIGKGKVTTLRGYAKTRPIQHGEGDNSEVLEQESVKAHQRFAHIKIPDNMFSGNNRIAANNGDGTNGQTFTAPPQSP